MLRGDMREDQTGIVNRSGFDGNKQSNDVAVVSGRAVDLTVRRKAAIERFGRIVAPEPAVSIQFTKIAAMQRIAKIIGDPPNPPQFAKIKIVDHQHPNFCPITPT